jgi:small subunit ribosomal protein S4
MARNTDPQCKQCRRAAEKLFLKGDRCYTAKCAIIKRNYPPGFHGPKGKKRVSDYATQLNEKQKAKREYRLLEKQFRLTFEKARRQTGNTGENFLKFLEMRLDNAVYRLNFAQSRSQARQLVNHGHFTVNGRKVNIPSYNLKAGDVIAIKENKAHAKIFNGLKERLKNKEIPGWLNIDMEKLTAKVLQKPDTNVIKPNFNIQMIIEYYSR